MDKWTEVAESLLGLLESDFGQSGRDVRLEAIKCELEKAFYQGMKEHRRRVKQEQEF